MSGAPPELRTAGAPRDLVSDLGRWTPYVHRVLEAAGLPRGAPAAGHNATYPTFVVGDAVVKFHGGLPPWRESHAAEARALELVRADPGIRAPEILARGDLFEDPDFPWPYLIQSRMVGRPLRELDLGRAARRRVAADLGDLARRLGEIDPAGLPALEAMPEAHVMASLRRSSLPAHLLDQVPGFLAGIPDSPPVFVHGDLVQNHLYVADGALAGVIDWGDALAADPLLELGKVFFAGLARDRELLGIFLEARGWAPGEDFARRALRQLLLRQAKGLLQHRGFDVLDGLGEVVAVEEVTSLEDLATRLFGQA